MTRHRPALDPAAVVARSVGACTVCVAVGLVDAAQMSGLSILTAGIGGAITGGVAFLLVISGWADGDAHQKRAKAARHHAYREVDTK